MGLGAVPLMCAREIPVVGSMPLVVRVLMHLHTERIARPRCVRSTSTGPSRCVMTSGERVAVVGTGLIGTSVALAAARAGAVRHRVGRRRGRDRTGRCARRRSGPRDVGRGCRRRAPGSSSSPPRSRRSPPLVATCLEAAPDAIVTDVGSVKTALVREVGRSSARGRPRPLRAGSSDGRERAVGARPRVAHRSSTASSGRSPPTARAIPWRSTRWRRGPPRWGRGRSASTQSATIDWWPS